MSNGTELVKSSTGLKALCDSIAPKVASVLPKHLTPERMLKTVQIAASKNPKLLQCTKLSLATAIMGASELGLDCSGTLGSAYLVPYGKEATLLIGYRGLIDLARRSGKIRSIEARLVYEDDTFDLDFGRTPMLIHKPDFTAERSDDKIVLVYARARLADQEEPQVEVMSKAEIDAIRKRSRAGSSGPWVTDYGEMARKTVVRRLCKYLPMSVEVERAFQIEDSQEGDRLVAHVIRPAEQADAQSFLDETTSNMPENAPEEPVEPAEPEKGTTTQDEEESPAERAERRETAVHRVLADAAKGAGWDDARLRKEIKKKGADIIAWELMNMEREEFDMAVDEAAAKEENE